VAAVAHLDTHVVAWLYEGAVDRLSRPARSVIDRGPVAVSPMVRLELHFLHEVGRITEPPAAVLDELAASIGLHEAPADLSRVVLAAAAATWARDPFDRLIVGHADADGARLVSRDRTIREHCSAAVW
jgi:PIN domain nuclease of toxin-antitoxin system